eukprot:2451387-Pleurochrysis_carterae.AAC.1
MSDESSESTARSRPCCRLRVPRDVATILQNPVHPAEWSILHGMVWYELLSTFGQTSYQHRQSDAIAVHNGRGSPSQQDAVAVATHPAVRG